VRCACSLPWTCCPSNRLIGQYQFCAAPPCSPSEMSGLITSQVHRINKEGEARSSAVQRLPCSLHARPLPPLPPAVLGLSCWAELCASHTLLRLFQAFNQLGSLNAALWGPRRPGAAAPGRLWRHRPIASRSGVCGSGKRPAAGLGWAAGAGSTFVWLEGEQARFGAAVIQSSTLCESIAGASAVRRTLGAPGGGGARQ